MTGPAQGSAAGSGYVTCQVLFSAEASAVPRVGDQAGPPLYLDTGVRVIRNEPRRRELAHPAIAGQRPGSRRLYIWIRSGHAVDNGRTANLLGSPRKSGASRLHRDRSALGGTHHLLYSAPRESGRKRRKLHVSKPRFHHRLRRQRRATEVNKQGAPVAVFSVATQSSWKNVSGGYDFRTVASMNKVHCSGMKNNRTTALAPLGERVTPQARGRVRGSLGRLRQSRESFTPSEG